MKNVVYTLICFLFFAQSRAIHVSPAKDLVPIKVTMNDGQIKTGGVKSKFDPERKITIFYEDGKQEDLPAADVKEFTLSTAQGELRYENVPYYKNRQMDIAQPVFMMVMVHAPQVPLAMYLKTPWKQAIGENAAASMYNTTNFYAQREGEPAATLLSSVMQGQANPNAYFRKVGPDYFADYPELAKKIENKTFTYETVMMAALEYIQWKVGPENMGSIKKN